MIKPADDHPRRRSRWSGGPLIPAPARRWLPLGLLLAVGWVGGWGWAVHGDANAISVDNRVDGYIFDLPQGLKPLTRAVVDLADPKSYAVFAVVLFIGCLVLRAPWAAVTTAVSIAVEVGTVEAWLKPLVDRTLGGAYSYPSGHCGAVTVLATIVVLLALPDGALGRRINSLARAVIIIVAAVVVVIVAGSLIYDGDHRFTDILGAVPYAAGVTVLVSYLIDLVSRRAPRPRLRRTPPSSFPRAGRP